jgi:uncharacterized RDD family membrane protein YckC
MSRRKSNHLLGSGFAAQSGDVAILRAMTMSSDTAKSYAGFWRRVGAAIIDAIIVGVATSVVVSIVAPNPIGSYDPTSNGIGVIAGWLYFALFESSVHQGTPGKMILGLIVTDEAGRRVSFWRATGRHFAKFLSAVILCIGFLMVAFTQRKQGLHDILAKTLVMKK